MKVIYLNPTYKGALEATDVDLKTIKSIDDLSKHLSYEDIGCIINETEALLSTRQMKNFGLENLAGDTVYVPDDEEHLNAMRKDLSSIVCACTAVDANTVILYADSEESTAVDTMENVLNALVLIMPVDAVMQTGQYQQFILQ